MKSRLLAAGAVASAAFAFSATAALAQRVLVFGDSLSDNGNLTASLGCPASPTCTAMQAAGQLAVSPPYYGTFGGAFTRYSNGPVWAEQLFGPLGNPLIFSAPLPGNVDFAFAGARTDTATAVPGVPIQIGGFHALYGTFAPTDTVSVWAGANDIFQFFSATPPANINQTTIAAASGTAAANQVSNVQSLIGLGARTIIVPNLPPLGSAPAYSGSASSSQAGNFASSSFNSALSQGLNQLASAAPAGTNIVQADIYNAFAVVIANPSAYGISNASAACVFTPSCVTGSHALQNTYLFWDSVHPTEAGHAIIAEYIGLLLNSGTAAAQSQAQLGEVGLWSNLHTTDVVFERLRNWVSGVYQSQNGIYAEILGVRGDSDAHGNVAAYDYDLAGIRAGFDKKFDTSLMGGSVAFLDGNQSGTALRSDIRMLRADAYATTTAGQAFFSADMGAAVLWFENVKRATGFGPLMTDSTADGHVFNATGEAGYVAQMGSFQLIPSVRLGYIHANINGYDEGAPVLAQSYGEQTIDAVTAGARLRAVTYFNLGETPASAFAEVGYEDFISMDRNAITARLANNTALPSIVSPDDPNGPGVNLKAGLSSKVSEGLSVDVVYGLTLHNGDGETHAGHIRLKSAF